MRNFLLNIFIHNKFPICGRMAGWGTRDPKQSLGLYCLVSSSHGFNTVGRLRPFHDVGHAMGPYGRWAY